MSAATRPDPDRQLTCRLDEIGRLPLAAHPEALEAVLSDVESQLDGLRRSLPTAADGTRPGPHR